MEDKEKGCHQEAMRSFACINDLDSYKAKMMSRTNERRFEDWRGVSNWSLVRRNNCKSLLIMQINQSSLAADPWHQRATAAMLLYVL